MSKQKLKSQKVDVSLLMVCSAIPVFTNISASAEGTKSDVRVSLPKSPDLIAPIPEDKVVFSPENPKSQPEELSVDERVLRGSEIEVRTTKDTKDAKEEKKEVLFRGGLRFTGESGECTKVKEGFGFYWSKTECCRK